MALAFDPNGSAIVFARPDGSMAILEAGPNDCLWVRTLDLIPHLQEYATAGRVWIRRRCVPLTPEQSARLTEFALAQDGKRFALGRLGAQLTPFRHRGPIRTYFVGKPCGDRQRWFCSELVTEACVAAGLLDPERSRPSATYPHDLFYGRSYNLFINSHLDINAGWYPPALDPGSAFGRSRRDRFPPSDGLASSLSQGAGEGRRSLLALAGGGS